MTDKKEVKKVKIKLPRLRDGSEEEVFAAVNGESFKIKRGVEVSVPEYIAEVIRNSEMSDDEADGYISANSGKE